MSKNTWVALLVCVNLVLLTGLCLANYSLPTAHAQGSTSLADNYMLVTGEIQDQYDALYIIDVRERTLHAFYWERGHNQLVYADWLDLERDFRNNRP